MKFLRRGMITAAMIGSLWAIVVAVTIAVSLSFATGASFRPGFLGCSLFGLLTGLLAVSWKKPRLLVLVLTGLGAAAMYFPRHRQ